MDALFCCCWGRPMGVPFFNEKTPTYAFVSSGFLLNTIEIERARRLCCSFIFSVFWVFLICPFLCFYAHPPMGVVVINNTAKLNPLNDKVKFFQWQLLTVVFTFLFFSVVHILWIHFFIVCLHHRNDAVPNTTRS